VLKLHLTGLARALSIGVRQFDDFSPDPKRPTQNPINWHSFSGKAVEVRHKTDIGRMAILISLHRHRISRVEFVGEAVLASEKAPVSPQSQSNFYECIVLP